MEQLFLSNSANSLKIEGYPDAVKAIKIKGELARRLSNLTLHRADLDFAKQSLDSIDLVASSDNKEFLQQALWRSAIIHYIKCFGEHESRFSLSQDKIYKDKTVLEGFEYFKALRNKHFIHDENSHAQSFPGAILNNGTKSYKIEKIININTKTQTLDIENYNNLKLLINHALDWVVGQYDSLCIKLTDELEKNSYEELLALDALAYRNPLNDSLYEARKHPT